MMSSAQRKVNTEAFANALKQVYYIHKSVVAELWAQIDIVSTECKMLKESAHISRSRNCESCVHSQEVKRHLHEHFNKLLNEKDKDIKALEAKLQAQEAPLNTSDPQNESDRILLEDISYVSVEDNCSDRGKELSLCNPGARQHPLLTSDSHDAIPLEEYNQEQTTCLTGTDMNKNHSRLRLARQGKRHSHYTEEQGKAKWSKISPGSSERDDLVMSDKVKLKELKATRFGDSIFVPDTECTRQQLDQHNLALSVNHNAGNKHVETDDGQSWSALVVPETLAADDVSYCDHETDVEWDKHDDNDRHAESMINQEDAESTNSDLKEPLFVQDHLINDSDRNFPFVRPLPQATFNHTSSENVTVLVEKKMQNTEAVQKSLKDVQFHSNSSRSSEDITMKPQIMTHYSSEGDCAKSKFSIKSSPGAEIQNTVNNRVRVSHILSGSGITQSKLLDGSPHKVDNNEKSSKLQRHTLNPADSSRIRSKIFSPVKNGSMNPDINLLEYLDSEMSIEDQEQDQTLAALDETVAPNLISQCIQSQQEVNTASQVKGSSKNMINETAASVHSTQKSETPRKMETVADKFMWNSQISLSSNATHLPEKNICRELKDEDKIKMKVEDKDCEDGKENDLEDSVFVDEEDDPDTIKPSPQFFPNGSQQHDSIPSSFKFISKWPKRKESSSQGTCKSSQKVLNVDEKEAVSVDLSRNADNADNDNQSLDFGISTIPDMKQDPAPQSFLDDFDRVPKPVEHEFAHVCVVRKRSERNKLEGFSCKQCYDYYKNSGLSEAAMKEKQNQCSRHRDRYRAPPTPEHFWSLGFPDTAEMEERREKHHSSDSPVSSKKAPRRRQQLVKKF